MRLVYLSPVPWASFAQRPHKFVEWFHKRSGEGVLWIEPYPTRFPVASDFKRLRSTTRQDVREQPSWLQVVKPAALPLEPLPGSGWLNALMWREVFIQLDTFVNRGVALVVIGKPSVLAVAVLQKLQGCRSIYDAMDDFPAFYRGLSRLALCRREEKLVRLVNAMWVSSMTLKRRWNGLRPDVQLVHNGLDASSLPQSKQDLAIRRNKVFGYVGTIGDWFDWEWVIKLAEIRPTDVVRLVGPVFHAAPVALPKNIELMPPCEHESALKAMCEFDVGLIPFKINELTASVDPIKYYEYRALGLPIISTDFGEMRFRGSEIGTFISKNVEDIENMTLCALLFRHDPIITRQFALDNSWESRFDAGKIFS